MEDKKYIEQINDLIPEAERLANEKMLRKRKLYELREGQDGKLYKHCFWSQYFHAEMKRLAIEAGLRN